jgi:hypothetical protein
MGSYINFTPEEINYIIEEFKTGSTLKELSIIYKVSAPTITRVLLENNVKTDYREEKAYEFLSSNKKELLYFWGFVLGDGSLTKQNYIVITIDQKDRKVLERFCDWFGYPHNRIKEYIRKRKNGKENTELQLSICNNLLPTYTDRYGIVNNKTYNPKLPDLTIDELKSFLLGLLDADGHILYDEPRISGTKIKKDNTISVVGDPVIMEWVIKCYRSLGFNGKVIHKKANKTGKSTRAVVSKKSDIIKLAQLLDLKDNYYFCFERKWKSIYNYLCDKL